MGHHLARTAAELEPMDAMESAGVASGEVRELELELRLAEGRR